MEQQNHAEFNYHQVDRVLRYLTQLELVIYSLSNFLGQYHRNQVMQML